MIRVSSANIIYGKYSGLALTFVGNVLLLAMKNDVGSVGRIIAFNGGVFFTAGLISIYAFRLWDVEVYGDIVVAKRFKKRLSLRLVTSGE